MSREAELPQGVSLFNEDGQTLILEKVDDAVSVSLEPVKVMSIHEGVAFTGIRYAADFLGLHENTVRRYADKGILGSIKTPGGNKRIRIDSLKEVRSEMYGEL